MAALIQAYHVAQTTLSNTSEFGWFWLGMLLIELPIAGLVARRITAPTMRTALIVLYGLVSYAPKLLRNPSSPVYHDEYAHWRSTYEILNTGKLFSPNPLIYIIARYPGLHAATATIVHATGLSIWQAATLLLILLHVTLVLGIFALAEAIGFNNRTASLIAILYSLNSSFLYFDTQYSYESMAITLVVWTLVAYVRAIRSQPGEGRPSWSVLVVVLSAGTVVTHHLSTLMLILIMALVSLGVSVPWLAKAAGWVGSAVAAWSLTLITALMAAAWVHFVAPATWSYLSPYLGESLSQLLHVVKGTGSARQLFGASLSPWWEQKSAYLVPVLALGFTVGGLLIMWAWMRSGRLPQGRRRRAVLSAFVFLGLVYFPSTIFLLSPGGAEGARRSWAFTWIGLSMLAGAVAVWLLDWVERGALRWKRVSLRFALATALTIAMVGGTAAGQDASYRFPGPFLYGSDTRSVTSELLRTSNWFRVRFGPGNKIIADRYTGLVFASFGLQNNASASAGFPVYDLYLAKPGSSIKPSFLLTELTSSNYTYLVVDQHMAYEFPELGVYFGANDPAVLRRHSGKPIFSGRLNKFNTIQWMIKIYQSNSYSIYRLNLPPSNTNSRTRTPMSKGKVLQGKFAVTR